MKVKLIFFVIGLSIITIYYYPTPSRNFLDLYPYEDEISKSYKAFIEKNTKEIIVDGIKWSYYTNEQGKKTILFLHGMGGSYDIWWQQIQELEQTYNVISYTLPEQINSLTKTAKGIKSILAKEKITSFSVVGSSMGGYIAQYLLQTMPENLDKVVFGNTFPPNDIIIEENSKKSMLIPYLPAVLIEKFMGKQLKTKIVPAANNSELLKAVLPSIPFSKKQFINRYKVVIDKFAITQTDSLINSIPKLIIESDNDPMVHAVLRKATKNTYKEASVHTFHNAGHFPYINKAEKYNSVLLDFFNNN